ncbi:MAG: DNA-3-methyladenine glycosylase [Clostridiales bacterium]|uniref:DNA-3-methyladenine glycosylase n=1 Tax=Clostridium sp. N3C TaxID=1776758 RepID=UPI00092E1D04|nr:DNA-3-methyladenine glycosylase [Clostridium sp. N3C]NLZ48291.1 DNA-3-methyladenine glycosylase [Clostridiales bacterium]SCN22948.1 3-methyladenine DNA glycosylase [Clostridium sp. N3C]
MKKLERSFYSRDTLQVAEELLGKYLVRKINDKFLIGKIVEVEAYMGEQDKAAHSYGGRRTERNEVMYGEAGHIYVYFIYGMHYCFNVITEKVNVPRGVLIRALEPMDGMEIMALNRYKKSLEELTSREIRNLTNGPAKLCSALNITREHNGMDICKDDFYIGQDEKKRENFEIVKTTRINIDYAEEARFYPWRFYIKDNPYVSKK